MGLLVPEVLEVGLEVGLEVVVQVPARGPLAGELALPGRVEAGPTVMLGLAWPRWPHHTCPDMLALLLRWVVLGLDLTAVPVTSTVNGKHFTYIQCGGQANLNVVETV